MIEQINKYIHDILIILDETLEPNDLRLFFCGHSYRLTEIQYIMDNTGIKIKPKYVRLGKDLYDVCLKWKNKGIDLMI